MPGRETERPSDEFTGPDPLVQAVAEPAAARVSAEPDFTLRLDGSSTSFRRR